MNDGLSETDTVVAEVEEVEIDALDREWSEIESMDEDGARVRGGIWLIDGVGLSIDRSGEDVVDS